MWCCCCCLWCRCCCLCCYSCCCYVAFASSLGCARVFSYFVSMESHHDCRYECMCGIWCRKLFRRQPHVLRSCQSHVIGYFWLWYFAFSLARLPIHGVSLSRQFPRHRMANHYSSATTSTQRQDAFSTAQSEYREVKNNLSRRIREIVKRLAVAQN